MSLSRTPTLLKRRRTRIIATLGPASATAEQIAELMAAGVDVFRLNFSHGTAAEHRRTCARVRRAADDAGVEVAVLGDLCGPKIRVGSLPGGATELHAGQQIRILTQTARTDAPDAIPVPAAGIRDDARPPQRLLLDDGNLELRVTRAADQAGELLAEVVRGGRLTDRKGVNLPDTDLSLPSLTDQDRSDAALAVEVGVDWLALSFVRRAADLAALHELLAEFPAERRPAVLAKIEKPEALDNLDDILDHCEAVMVARGDLGVELPPESIPDLQDAIVARARERRRPVVVATQMLDSMIRNLRPTRAEVSDIAQAVRTGVDCVMLSGETAVGVSPVTAVDTMDRIVRDAEGRLWDRSAFGSLTEHLQRNVDTSQLPLAVSVGAAAADLSRSLRAHAIVVLSQRGTSAIAMSNGRPAAPLVVGTPDQRVRQRLALAWGVVPQPIDQQDFESPDHTAERLVRDLDLAEDGEVVLVVQGFQEADADSRPSITVMRLPSGNLTPPAT